MLFQQTSYLDPPDVVIQKRGQFGNPANYFQKRFDDYRRGFGANGELWLGLDKMHQLTRTGRWSLEVHLTDWQGNRKVAKYEFFKVGPPPRYQLQHSTSTSLDMQNNCTKAVIDSYYIHFWRG